MSDPSPSSLARARELLDSTPNTIDIALAIDAAEARGRQASAEENVEESADARRQFLELWDRYSAQSDELATLRAQLADAREECKALGAGLIADRDTISSLREYIGRCEKQLAEAVKERDELRAHVDKLVEIFDSLQACDDNCDVGAMLAWVDPADRERVRELRDVRLEDAASLGFSRGVRAAAEVCESERVKLRFECELEKHGGWHEIAHDREQQVIVVTACKDRILALLTPPPSADGGEVASATAVAKVAQSLYIAYTRGRLHANESLWSELGRAVEAWDPWPAEGGEAEGKR